MSNPWDHCQLQWRHKVFYSDTDALSTVYHGNFLDFFERARACALEEAGYLLSECVQKGILFVVREAHLVYHKPLMLDHHFCIHSHLVSHQRVSMQWKQWLVLEDGKLATSAEIQVACIDRDFKPKRVPDEMWSALHAINDSSSL